MGVHVHRGVREIRAGAAEMLAGLDAQAMYLATVSRWLNGRPGLRMPGAETGAQILGRFDAALRWAQRQVGSDGKVVVVTHGCVTRFYSASRIDGITVPLVVSQPIRNGAITSAFGSVEDGWTAQLYSSRPVGDWEVDECARALMPSGLALK